MSDPTETASSQIPNLLGTLRASSRGRGGRRRGRGGHVASSQHHDAVIQGTDTDAAVSRLSAVDMGYMKDPYAALFVQSADGPSPRRLPIINRGSYTRTMALDRLVDLFLSDPGQKQIVSLGAGTDTRPFRLFSRKARSEWVYYHEVDFEAISEKKFWTVHTSRVLRNILINPDKRGDGWVSMPPRGPYYCHGIDLRTLADGTRTTLLGLRTDIPTLLLSECCLCYLEPTDASNIIKFFTSQIPDIGIAIYEPIKPNDAFGKMMVSNLAARNIQMPTLDIYPEAADQEQRLRDAEFTVARHLTIDQIWEDWVPAEEKYRLDTVEGLDEVEEWKLLASHYGVVWGSRGSGFQHWESLGQGA